MSSSSSSSVAAAAEQQLVARRSGGKFSFSQARARRRKSSTLSIVGVGRGGRHGASLDASGQAACGAQGADAAAVVGRRAVGERGRR